VLPVLVARVVALVVATAPSASRGSAVEASFFDELARRAYEKHAYVEALTSFLLVSDVSPSAGSLYNVAVTAELAGQADVAYVYYREYLASADTDAERRAAAEKRLLELCGALALVQVSSEPAGAAIYVDREELGAYGLTPRTLALSPGEHRILLEADGHEPAETTVTTSVGATAIATAVLAPRLGELVVATEPPGAPIELFRGPERVTVAGAHGHYRLPVGNYRVRIHPPGRVATETRVLVSEDATSSATLVAAPLPQPIGKLLISTGNVVASVRVDGTPVALTPTVLAGVRAGVHDVEVSARGCSQFRRRVLVRAGRSTYLEVALTAGPERKP